MKKMKDLPYVLSTIKSYIEPTEAQQMKNKIKDFMDKHSLRRKAEEIIPINGDYWTVPDVDRLPLNMIFSQQEIRDKKEQLKKSIRKSVDRIYKARYGDEF